MGKIFHIFDRGLSWADLLWRLITLIIIIFGGTTAAFLAKASELFKNSSLLVCFLIGIITALVLNLIFYLFNLSRKQAANTKYLNALSNPVSNINPLLGTFEDNVIKLSDLQLPLNQSHEHKHFKRCKIVGPGAVAILGGTYINTNFINCGDVFIIPDHTNLTGVIGLIGCTLDNCELIDITIFTSNSPKNIENLLKLNARVIVGDLRTKG
ncbi:hypothetical protein HCY58_11025 [Acinetobacter radioresistens]|uniref:hypothetical protein n=1 Tax=Acinetobacter radioresistens TaxID=40216 RepID=UPI002002EEB0|nr:hypothetical protein [Acinetobacter radioresistens]MCK4087580.1 hypothetical protein [Acinetobacter radioresistens]